MLPDNNNTKSMWRIIAIMLPVITAIFGFTISENARITDNERWLGDLQKVVDNYIQEQKRWDSEEREYDHEVRLKVDAVDRERQAAFRTVWDRLVELTNKCTDKK